KTDATKELDDALRIRPSDPNIWFFKGSIHFDLKQKKQAIEAFEKVIELDPKFKNARRMLSKSKRIKVKKKVSRDEYPCFGEYEKGEEGCEECDIREQCMEKRMK
ncbi:MAG: tetratricopeptide repeat protein, partial [Thermoplasmata archaeon]